MKTLINLTMRLEDGGIVKDYMYSPITSEQIEEEKKETKYLYGSKVIEIEIIKAEFLAASRTAIPILLDALEAARKALQPLARITFMPETRDDELLCNVGADTIRVSDVKRARAALILK